MCLGVLPAFTHEHDRHARCLQRSGHQVKAVGGVSMWIMKMKSRSFSKATSAINSVSHLSSPILTLFKFTVSRPCVGPGRVNSRPLKGSIVMIHPCTHDRVKSEVSPSRCFKSHSFCHPVSPLPSEESQKFNSFQGSSWS